MTPSILQMSEAQSGNAAKTCEASLSAYIIPPYPTKFNYYSKKTENIFVSRETKIYLIHNPPVTPYGVLPSFTQRELFVHPFIIFSPYNFNTKKAVPIGTAFFCFNIILSINFQNFHLKFAVWCFHRYGVSLFCSNQSLSHR